MLKFSRDDKRKDHLVQVEEIELAFEDEPVATDISAGVFAGLKKFFEGFASAHAPAPAKVEKTAAAADLSAFAAQLGEQMEKANDDFADFLASMNKTIAGFDTRLTKVAADQAQLKTVIETSPRPGYTARPLATGGDGALRAEC